MTPHPNLSRRLLGGLALMLFFCLPAGARRITDATGRQLEIPDKPSRIYCTSPVGSILVYTLAPEKLAGWNYALTPEEKRFIAPAYHDLPALGGWFGKSAMGNLEEIVKAHPDLILSAGSIDPLSISLSERLQKQSGIPVVMLGGALKDQDSIYRFTGDLLGVPGRAAELAAWCRRTLDEVTSRTAAIPREKRPRVYYAEGPKGLETDPSGSFHTEVLDLVGAVNVAQVPSLSSYGRATVSMEQLLAWNPEIIIAGWEHGSGPGGFLAQAKDDPAWRLIAAIKNGRVYETPQYPFNWFDRPPSVNRILGVKWAAALLYPEVFKYDMRQDVKNFYDKFYHVTLTEADVTGLLEHAMPRQ